MDRIKEPKISTRMLQRQEKENKTIACSFLKYKVGVVKRKCTNREDIDVS